MGKPVFATLLAPLIRHFDIAPSHAEWLAFAVGFTIITFLHIVVGELAPKSLAIQKPCPRPCGWHALYSCSTDFSIQPFGCLTMLHFGCSAVLEFGTLTSRSWFI